MNGMVFMGDQAATGLRVELLPYGKQRLGTVVDDAGQFELPFRGALRYQLLIRK